MLLYFAYGSNMSTPRLRARIPSALTVGSATLQCHRLVFHKVGRDGSAKCDARHTGLPADMMHGVVFEMSVREKALLDRLEGVGQGYAVRYVTVTLDSGTAAETFIYSATRTDAALKPFDWYLEHVLNGAHEHGLPAGYIASIAATATVADPDRSRRERERAIHLLQH